MKKLICLFACFAIVIGMLSGCGDKNTDDTTTTETTVTELVTENTVAERKVTLGYYKGKSLNHWLDAITRNSLPLINCKYPKRKKITTNIVINTNIKTNTLFWKEKRL